MLVRDVLFPVKPEVFGPFESMVFLGKEFAVFVLADSVYGLANVLHDMEPVIDDLSGRTGHMFERGLEVGFSHVHGHSLDLL